MTNKELKKELKKRGVEFGSKDKKVDLEKKLAKDEKAIEANKTNDNPPSGSEKIGEKETNPKNPKTSTKKKQYLGGKLITSITDVTRNGKELKEIRFVDGTAILLNEVDLEDQISDTQGKLVH